MSVTLKSCCFCFSLHTGSLIIGYVYSLISLMELFLYSMFVTLRPLSTHKFVLFTALAVVSFLQLLCCILLVVGITKKRASLTLPWTMVSAVMSVVFLFFCITGISLIIQDAGLLLGEEAFMIFFHLARACISLYCVAVVHSRHKQIMLDKNEERFLYSARLYSPVKTDAVE